MRPISPAPSRNPSGGFTFVETIVALAVCVVLLSVVTQTLLASLRAEQTANWLQEGSLICDRLAASRCAELSAADVVAGAGKLWRVTDDVVQAGDLRWTVWTATPVDRPSLAVSTAFREL